METWEDDLWGNVYGSDTADVDWYEEEDGSYGNYTTGDYWVEWYLDEMDNYNETDSQGNSYYYAGDGASGSFSNTESGFSESWSYDIYGNYFYEDSNGVTE